MATRNKGTLTRKNKKIFQVRLSEEQQAKLETIPGRNASEKMRSLIDGGYYLPMPELAVASTELKDALFSLKQVSTDNKKEIKQVEEAVNQLCRLL